MIDGSARPTTVRSLPRLRGAFPETGARRARRVEREARDHRTECPAGGIGRGYDEAPLDPMSPEAIAKRVARPRREDEVERLARDEELKLARAACEGGRRKGRRAASRLPRRSASQQIGSKAPPKRVAYRGRRERPRGSRAPSATGSARTSRPSLAAARSSRSQRILGGGGYVGWWTAGARRLGLRHDITKALHDEHGRIGDPAKDDDDTQARTRGPCSRPTDERRDAALAKYKEVEAQVQGHGRGDTSRASRRARCSSTSRIPRAPSPLQDASQSPLAMPQTPR